MARIAAGARNRLVRLWPITLAEDALGTETLVTGQAIAEWCSVQFGTGSERREAGQSGSVLTGTFRVPFSTAIAAADELWEIEFDGARWGITSIIPIGEATELEFTATRKGA